MNRKQRISLGLLVASIVLILVAWSSMYVVTERELVVVLQFGDPVIKRVEPGLYFKAPLIQEVRRLPKTLQFWHTSEPIVDLLTSDGEKIEVTAWAIWRITDPQTFVRLLRTQENAESTQIKVKVRAAIRDVITSNTLTDVIRNSNRELTYTFQSVLPGMDEADGEVIPDDRQPVVKNPVGREAILEIVKKKVKQSLQETADGESTERGIELVKIGMGSISFVPTVRDAAFEKQRAFMESIAARHLNEGERRKQEILNKTGREVEKILGEGEETSSITRGEVDSEIIGKYAKAIEQTGDFYNFIRTLEVYQKSFDNSTRLILTTDSKLFRLLKEVEPTQ